MSRLARIARPDGLVRACLEAGYPQAGAAVVVATVVAGLLSPLLAPANLVMTYLLAVVVVSARYSRGASIFATVAGVAAFDFFFVPPYLTFAVADTQYLLTFAAMLAVGLVISGLTLRIRRQAEAAVGRERRTAALYAMSRELAETGAVKDLAAIAAHHLDEVFDAAVAVSLAGADQELEIADHAGAVPLREEDTALIRWAWEHRQPAGLGTATASRARAIHVPLLGHGGPLGVVTVVPRRRDAFATAETRHQLETFVNQTALAVQRARAAEEAQKASVRAETERLRNALLTSVSHDLRTPLATITGAATTILDAGPRLPDATRQELLESIRDEAARLNRLVQNLLQMTRLESGALRLHRDWHSLEEVLGAALGRLARALGDRRVTVSIPPDLPLVPMDDVLIEQVLVNILDNAVKYTPPSSPIRIVGTASNGRVTVEVADCGPGLPPGEERRVFEKFYQAAGGRRQGAGLGLAICRGIVAAHGGRIWAQSSPGTGAAFLFTLPLGDAPSVADDA